MLNHPICLTIRLFLQDLVRMLQQDSENFRELCLYFISTQQWSEAYELHQQTYGSSPAEAQNVIGELAVRYGYAVNAKSKSMALLATGSLMTIVLASLIVRVIG